VRGWELREKERRWKEREGRDDLPSKLGDLEMTWLP